MSVLTLEQAIETKRGLPYAQALAELLAETKDVVGPIEGKDLRDIVTVLCSGLDYRLSQAPESPLKSALTRAFNSMNINEFGFNLADPLVSQLLDAGVLAGLVDVNERLWFYGIATKQVPLYPNVSMKDIISQLEPSLLDDTWKTLDSTGARRFHMRLKAPAPAVTYVIVQAQDTYEDGTVSEWYHLTAQHGVQAVREYTCDIPASKYSRKLRWKCEYALDHVVSVS